MHIHVHVCVYVFYVGSNVYGVMYTYIFRYMYTSGVYIHVCTCIYYAVYTHILSMLVACSLEECIVYGVMYTCIFTMYVHVHQ